MSQSPPFDPPFQAISAEFGKAMLAFSDGSRTASATGSVPAAGKGGEFFLRVPFAEKDEAKQAGARWNPKARKWYVPAGADRELFKRWWET